ncbi:unnamed protein product [Anisakis simplex]|uniref:MarR family transcriptional regulator n=1 Tax=Anisakis simplex TaxID=6269 RepID=A0A0M3KJ42_ANISI|nr:unnamed protein product [Anisakis simplex]
MSLQETGELLELTESMHGAVARVFGRHQADVGSKLGSCPLGVL